jgi:shikimate O-hydroxycinnamoyltransferase
MCVARRLAPASDTHLGVIVNVRARLRPPLPHSFFGNAALQAPALPRRVGDVIDGPPASVVGMIMDAVNSVDDTYVRAVVDYHELPKENLVLGAMEPPESDVAMVSWLGMPLYDADFGWGVPELVMPTTVSVFSGMVLVLPRGLDKESGIIVVVNLEPEYLPALKKLLYDVVL